MNIDLLLIFGIMKINNVTSNYINTFSGTQNQSISSVSAYNLETSIYNQKGVTLPFCGVFKGVNMFEENCAVLLRKMREGRCRKFTEWDISDIVKSLRQEKESDKIEKFLQDIIYALEESDCDKNTFKRIISLTAGKSDEQQYAILAFADHEIQNAKEPLKAFFELSAEKREKLMPFLEKINVVGASEDTTQALYDLFRTIVYADEDMAKLSGNALNKYKIDTCNILKEDIGYFENIGTYSSEKSKKDVVSTAKEIYHYFVDNMI